VSPALGCSVRFLETSLAGAYVLEPERVQDERGFFARAWDARELEDRGLCGRWVQSSISFNAKAGTLRGMHYQVAPHEEVKLVTCTAGAVFDVVVDLRADSPTWRQWFAVELTAGNGLVLYVPAGFAHGFLTLEAGSTVEYHMSEAYDSASARGARWDDPVFGISWPAAPGVISQRDREWPDHVVRP